MGPERDSHPTLATPKPPTSPHAIISYPYDLASPSTRPRTIQAANPLPRRRHHVRRRQGRENRPGHDPDRTLRATPPLQPLPSRRDPLPPALLRRPGAQPVARALTATLAQAPPHALRRLRAHPAALRLPRRRVHHG